MGQRIHGIAFILTRILLSAVVTTGGGQAHAAESGDRAGNAFNMPGIAHGIAIPLAEVDISAIRAQGAGGQNVNKVSNAVHLRFDIGASSLPETIKERLRALRDQRISSQGVIVIKAQRFRSLEKNREDALARLRDLVARAILAPAKRKPTRPTRSSQRKRLESKARRGGIKALRSRVVE